MSILRVHLWKEWREHRIALGFLALFTSLLILALDLVASRRSFDRPLVLILCGGLALLMELVAGESEETRTRFFERLPRGLPVAFHAKLLFLLGALSAFAVTGMLAAWAGAWWQGRAPSVSPDPLEASLLALTCAAVALWTLAVSPWAPRGALAVPVAAFLLGVLAWPHWTLGSGRWYRPTGRELAFLMTVLLAGALASAQIACVRGRTLGAGKLRIAARAIPVAALVLAPSWAWGAVRLRERCSIDPASPHFAILETWIGDAGRMAFVTAHDDSPRWREVLPHALIVDLATGDWDDAGGPGTLFERVQLRDEEFLADWPDVPCDYVVKDWTTREPLRFFEGESGSERADEDLTALRQTGRPAGLGEHGGPGHRGELWDPYRNGYYALKQVLPAGWSVDRTEILVTPTAWLLRRPEPPCWHRFDPVTRSHAELDWPENDDLWTYPILADGRVFLTVDGDLFLADARDASLLRIRPEEEPDHVTPLHNAYRAGDPFRPGQPILLRDFEDLYRFDDDSRSLRRLELDWREQPVGALPDGSVVLVSGTCRLVRLRLDSGERRVLFPLDS